MSPAINDPGTAVNAIDYLTELFSLRMQKNDTGIITTEGETYIKIAIVQFEELVYNVMASLRTYCKHDPIVMQKLVLMLKYLKKQTAEDKSYYDTINKELKILMDDMKFDSKKDEHVLKTLVDSKTEKES